MLYSHCVYKGFLINHLNFVKFGDHKIRKIHVYFLQVSCMCYYVILFSSRIAQKPAIIIVVVVVNGILYGIPITTCISQNFITLKNNKLQHCFYFDNLLIYKHLYPLENSYHLTCLSLKGLRLNIFLRSTIL